jgi:hypothetical protein
MSSEEAEMNGPHPKVQEHHCLEDLRRAAIASRNEREEEP